MEHGKELFGWVGCFSSVPEVTVVDPGVSIGWHPLLHCPCVEGMVKVPKLNRKSVYDTLLYFTLMQYVVQGQRKSKHE